MKKIVKNVKVFCDFCGWEGVVNDVDECCPSCGSRTLCEDTAAEREESCRCLNEYEKRAELGFDGDLGVYDYAELVAALDREESARNLCALGEWFQHYGGRYWDGECWTIDEKSDRHLYPISRPVTGCEDQYETVGYTTDPNESRVVD